MRDADAEQPATAAAALAYLDASYAAWDGLLRSLQPGELWRPMGEVAGPFEGEPVVALVTHILDELVHHAAEVALLRDLYAAGRSARMRPVPARMTRETGMRDIDCRRAREARPWNTRSSARRCRCSR